MGISVLFKLFAFLAIEICIVLYTIAVESPKICLIRHSLLTLPLAPLLRYFRIRSLADGEILAYDLKDILHLPPYTMNIVKRLENLQLYDFFKVSTKSQSDILAKAGFPSSHILLAGIGMEISKVPRYELAGIRPVTYGYFGSMEKWQGVDFLIRSFSKVVEKEKSALLYLIGEGSLTEELRRKTMDLGMSSNILFCSSVSREQLWEEYFRLFRVAVIPRPAFGGKSALIPMKLVEALAAGKPVIATTLDGIKEMTGGGGVLEVTPGDENMLAAAMLSLARDNVLLLEMSNAALKTSQKFDIEPVITKIFVMLEN